MRPYLQSRPTSLPELLHADLARLSRSEAHCLATKLSSHPSQSHEIAQWSDARLHGALRAAQLCLGQTPATPLGLPVMLSAAQANALNGPWGRYCHLFRDKLKHKLSGMHPVVRTHIQRHCLAVWWQECQMYQDRSEPFPLSLLFGGDYIKTPCYASVSTTVDGTLPRVAQSEDPLVKEPRTMNSAQTNGATHAGASPLSTSKEPELALSPEQIRLGWNCHREGDQPRTNRPRTATQASQASRTPSSVYL